MPHFLLMMCSIVLSSLSQVALKQGMTTPDVISAVNGADYRRLLWAVVTNPFIFIGLFGFGISVVLWLFVLARTPLSTAYPFVSLGIAVTAIAGAAVFGEPFTGLKFAGVALVVLGVVAVGVG